MIATVLLCAASLAAQAPERSPAMRDLVWLSGYWETEQSYPRNGPHWTEEFWSRPARGLMVGLRREERGFDRGRRTLDNMRIEQEHDAIRLYQTLDPGTVRTYQLVRSSDREAVFENPGPEFPQRLTYRRDGDSVIVMISRMDGSDQQDWTYRRVPAEPPVAAPSTE